LSNQLFIHRDDSGIAVWAVDLVQTGRFGWTLARPGYVAMLAVPYRLSGDIASGAYLSVIAGLATIGVVGVWAWRRFTPSVAALAMAILTASQIHNYYSRAQQPASVVVLCLALAAFWYTPAANHYTRRDRARALGAGVLLGVALTCHPSSILFPVLFLVYELALIAEQRAWRFSAGRTAALFCGAALPVLAIQLATTWFGTAGGASTDFVSQFRGAYAYQSAGTNHVMGAEDLLYYPLSVLLVEGPLWTLSVGAAILWYAIRWVKVRDALQLFLLVQSLGLIVIWSAAGAIGSADHLRVILPAFPAAAIITASSARSLVRSLVLLRQGNPNVVGLGMAVATAATLAVGVFQSAPLMASSTGYGELARNVRLDPDVPVLVSGANDRSWRVLLDHGLTTTASGWLVEASEPPRGAGSPAPDVVREVQSLADAVLPAGGVPCYVIVASETDVLGYPGSPALSEIITRRYEEASRLAEAEPSYRALSDWVRFPIFRLEGADTGVQQVQSMARNGVLVPDRGRYTELYTLMGGDRPGCRS
jgi:hypothetical protein